MRWLVLLISLLPFTLSAQVVDIVTITITVQDSITFEPVPFATIKVDGNICGSTDFDGQARITLPKGEHYFEVRYVGYKNFQNRLTINADLEFLALLVYTTQVLDVNIVRGGKITREVLPSDELLNISLRELKRLDNLNICIKKPQLPTGKRKKNRTRNS